jgi:hypothetical protein
MAPSKIGLNNSIKNRFIQRGKSAIDDRLAALYALVTRRSRFVRASACFATIDTEPPVEDAPN